MSFAVKPYFIHEEPLLRRDNLDDAKVTDFLGSFDPILHTGRIEETEKTKCDKPSPCG